jgi:peptidoglycan/xylan/chitin deacetylase (PgdA/CDA1 family)
MALSAPIISFTFDDFPRSALHNGGAILRDHGCVGTYYISLGLAGQRTPTGKAFEMDDIDDLLAQGHELACHTFDHCDSWDTAPSEFEASILRNQALVAKRWSGVQLRGLSYPISYPRPGTKARVARQYQCARGGGQTFNTGVIDLNYLKAFFIEQSRDSFEVIKQAIDDNTRGNGWLIFATHDVCDSPTRFGCTPELFERVAKTCVASGAIILPVDAALERIRGNLPGSRRPAPEAVAVA